MLKKYNEIQSVVKKQNDKEYRKVLKNIIHAINCAAKRGNNKLYFIVTRYHLSQTVIDAILQTLHSYDYEVECNKKANISVFMIKITDETNGGFDYYYKM